jgi:hypothetical protein
MGHSDFQKKVQRDLAHRKKELVGLKQLVGLTQNEEEQAFLRRAFLPLQYAHWEGFIKFLGVEVLKHISTLNVKYIDLQPTFSAVAIYKALNSSIPENDRGRTKLLMKYVGGHFSNEVEGGVFSLSACDEWVDTKSNLNQEVLQELLLLFGIELTQAKKYEYIENKWLDTFLGRRNKIVHGVFERVGQDEFEESADRIVELLDSFQDVFLNYVERESFLR